MKKDVSEFYAKDRAAWHKWLMDNHQKQESVWLMYDRGKNRPLSYDDMIEEALCVGWIDSVGNIVSETKNRLYFSKRRPNGVWSKLNKERIKKLIDQGQMQPAGLEAIKVAKANGSWDTLTKADNMEQPPELVRLFKKYPQAKTNFEAFSPSSQRIILGWIYTAKRDETRQRRINQTVEKAKQNKKAFDM